MLFQTSLGVDIQASELCLACLKASSRDVQLAAHAVYPLEEGMVDEEKAAVVSELIQGFLRESRISPTSVFLGIPRNNAILKFLEFPIAVKENLRESLGYELEKHVPFSSEDVYFDYQIISEEKSSGLLKLLLVVVKKQTLSPFLKLAGLLRVGISGIEISSTALADYFLWEGGKHAARFRSFVYLTHEDLELGFLKQGLLTYSRALHGREEGNGAAMAISSGLKKIFEARAATDEAGEIIFCGRDEDRPIFEALNGDLGMAIRMVDLSRTKIPSSTVIPAYGLALKGVRKAAMNINLLPLGLRKKPSKFKFYTMFGLVSLTLLGAIAWGGGVFFQHQWTLDRLEDEIRRLGGQLEKVEQVKAEKKSIEDRINSLNMFHKDDQPVLDVLRELSERIPKDAWVNRFDFSEKGVQIQGEATSASELIPLLEASPMFGDVAFLSAITKVREDKERFRIGLSLK